MYPVSAAYKVAIAQDVRNVRIAGTITLIDETIINIADADIAQGSLYLTEQCVSGEDIEVGNVYASELGFTLITPPANPYSLKGARVLINFGIEVGGGAYEDVPLGYFYITEVERKDTMANIKALDGMILFDVDLTNVVTSGSPWVIINSCCSKVGVTLATSQAAIEAMANGTVELTLPSASKVKTCRDLIMWVCQVLGAFARMNRLGQLEIIPVTSGTSVKTIAKAQRFTTDVSDFAVKITKVAMPVGETEYAQGTDGMTMTLEENPLLAGKEAAEINTILSNLLAQVTQAEYTPYNVAFAGDPALQAGDYITLPETGVIGGGDVVSLITHSTWHYRGGHIIRAAGKGNLLRGVQPQQTKAVASVVAIARDAQELAQAANQSTQLIKDAIEGHVLIRVAPSGANEILIMDNPDPALAVKVWRWNMGGLGYSDNCTGVDNPDRVYTVAMTMDGAINADFLKVGSILTNLITIRGNTNFYWAGDYLYIVNPANGNEQIRLSKEGIRFTKDGGQTWRTALTFDGLNVYGDSETGYAKYREDGARVYNAAGELVGHFGWYETLADQTATFTRASVAYTSTGAQVAANVPRFEAGRFGNPGAIMVEEGTTPKLLNGFFVTDSNADGLCDNWEKAYNLAGATWSQVNITGWGGKAQRCEITDATYGGSNLGVSQLFSETAGNPISARMVGKTNKSSVTIILRDETNAVSFKTQTFTVTPGQLFDVSVSSTVPSGCTSVRAYFMCDKGTSWAVGDYIELYAAHVEDKPYSTSPTDGTRSPETLTIPTAGVLNPQEGTVECWFYYKPNGVYQRIISFVGSALNGYRDLQFDITNTGYVRFQPKKLADGTGTVYVLSASPITEGWHYAVCTWNQSEIKVAADDQPVQKLSYGGGIATLDTYFTVGKEHNATVAYLNSLIDDLRISSRARTDAEIAAAYASNAPLPVDEYTTYKMSFDNTLQPTVRRFGLWAKNGEISLVAPPVEGGIRVYDASGNLRTHIGQYAAGKYGAKVINGEIYASRFRTGTETDTTYIGLEPGGEPLLVKKNGKDALSIWLWNDYGSIQFFDTAANDMRGMITSFNDALGQGLRISGRNNAGYSKNVHIEGEGIRIDAAGMDIAIDPPSNGLTIWGDVYVYGSFNVTGSPKNAIEHTSQGYVALAAVEAPEIRYRDEGIAELVNGECRVDIDPLFLECIMPNTLETPWYTKLTPKGPFTLYEAEIGDTYFIVKSHDPTINGKFSWELSAVRKNMAGIRLQKVGGDDDVLTSNWEDELGVTISEGTENNVG